jgi:hypothetical protein
VKVELETEVVVELVIEDDIEDERIIKDLKTIEFCTNFPSGILYESRWKVYSNMFCFTYYFLLFPATSPISSNPSPTSSTSLQTPSRYHVSLN